MINFSPELKPIAKETEVVLRLPDTEPLSPPILQLNEIMFRYTTDRVIFSNVNLGATMDSRICIVSISISRILRLLFIEMCSIIFKILFQILFS